MNAPRSTTRGRSASPGRDTGSAPVEFVLVGALLTLVTLSVMQLGLVLHVRNTALDAASEGARFAALADAGLDEGRSRSETLLTAALGPSYARGVRADYGDAGGQPVVVVTVQVPLPLVGMIGMPDGLEVTGHAALEPTAAAPPAG